MPAPLPPDLQADLDAAADAARAAGRAVLRRFRTGIAVSWKGAGQPVTEADLEADALLRTALTAHRPAYGWLSEETADDPARLGRARVWVVDPIDGTNSFVAGIPEFVIVVGLAEAGRAVLGVVLNPATGELYAGAPGHGAWRDGAPIRVSPAGADAPAPRMLASRAEIARGDLAAFAAPWTLRAMGSTAYRTVKVAEGAAEAFVATGPKNEWDVCGAAAVLEAAGGRISRLDGGAIAYNTPDPAWRGVVATNGALHARVVAVARDLTPGGASP